MQVSVIRHTKVNLPSSVCYGQTDVDLAGSFEDEVKIIQDKIDDNFDAVFSSPLNRCLQLSQTFSTEIMIDERLKEFNFGDWEMQNWIDINPEEINPWYNDFVNTKTPNGESMNEMFFRLNSFMNDLRQQDFENVLIVTHGGIIRLIWCYLLQIPLKNTFKIPVDYHEVLKFNLGKTENEDFILQKK